MRKINLGDSISWRDVILRAAIIIGTVAVIVWAMPRDTSNYFMVEQGKPWKYVDFRAPFDFPIYKSEAAIRHERDSMMRLYEPYFTLNKEVEGRMVRNFLSDFQNGIPGVPDDYISIIANRLHTIYSIGVVGSADGDPYASDTAHSIRIVDGKNATSVKASAVLSTKEAYESLFADGLMEQHRQELQRCNLDNYISPNLIYDRARSTASRNDLLASIPLASGVVQKGQKIIDRGDIVDETAFRILESYKKENERREQDTTTNRIAFAGEALYALIVLICFTSYLGLFRKDYFERPRSVAMLYSLILIFAVLTSLMVRNTVGHVFMLPYAMAAVFIRVFMDSRTAFITHLTTVLICAAMLQHQFDFMVVETVAGLVAVYSLRELQYRSQLFKTAMIVTVACIGMNMACDMMNGSALKVLDWSNYNYFIVNGLLLLFAYPLLYLIEKAFGFTSDITLIELSNTNNPLLRKLSEVAPGTFQHSIQVGNLAAEIANKIGAKSQLVRTGALYHDIGKMVNPIYFTENQSGIDPHASLSCIESAQIIISHVTEGLKIADKYNLPDVIKDFISTHHGQGKAKYFCVKYKNEHPDEKVDDLLFTYPGPNPFTREQAILMMADTVEAASRAQHDYSEKSIRELVNRLIDGQLAEGYFKECPITFRDIAYAKTVLIEKLKSIYHTRVSYPTPNK